MFSQVSSYPQWMGISGTRSLPGGGVDMSRKGILGAGILAGWVLTSSDT